MFIVLKVLEAFEAVGAAAVFRFSCRERNLGALLAVNFSRLFTMASRS
jgi:hypothetical protein